MALGIKKNIFSEIRESIDAKNALSAMCTSDDDIG